MTQLTTRCPHCSTRFQLSQQQLDAAAGAVRCGACMQLFNAKLFMPNSQQPTPQPDSAPLSQVTAQPASYEPRVSVSHSTPDEVEVERDEIELDLDSDDFTAEFRRLALEEAEQAAQQNLPSAAQRVMPLRPVTEEPTSEPPITAEPDSFADSLPEPEPEPEPEPIIVEQHSAAQAADEPQLGLLDEPKPTEQLHLKPLIEPEPTDSEEEVEVEVEAYTEAEPEPVSLYIDPENLLSDRTDNDFAERLSALDDEPLQLDWPAEPVKRKRSSPLWVLLTLLALLGLPVQYLYYNFNQLALQDQSRPWLEALCELSNCQLPSKADIDQIQNTNLVVRQHPEFKGALIIDAILYNRAPFSQPFPRLELNFMDSAEQPLASRAFYPHEYLAGELAGSQQMPSQIPIHIALEVLLPDSQASRYGIRFLPN